MAYNDSMTTINKFLGLNEDTAGSIQLKLGESPKMTNFRLTESMKLLKREGYKSLFTSLGAYTIQGMWYGKVGGVYRLLFAANSKIYSVDSLLTPSPTIVGTTTVNAKTNFFFFDSKVYILNGTDYMSWNGTGSFTSVSGYIPLVATATSPAGSGTLLESINLLTGKKHQKFSGDGTSATYQLIETNLTSVDQVYVDGVLKTVTTHYTVNLTNGTITFTAGNIPANLSNNVDIYWTKGSGNRSEILSQKFAMIYGGATDSRVFVYGDGTNKYYYSGLANLLPSAEYFPANAYNVVGSNQFPITGIVRQYDRQIIFTTGGTYYSNYTVSDTFNNASGISAVSFPVFPLNDSVGNIAYGQIQIIQNNPYTIYNGIQEFTNTNVRDERNVRYLSKRVKQSLENMLLENAITIDWEYKKEYWIAIGKEIWIHNYLIDAWYKFELYDTPTYFLVIDDTLYFGTTNGQIMYFNEDTLIDNGNAILGYWESGFLDFGTSWQQKYLQSMWLSLKPGLPQNLTINWLTDNNASTYVNTIEIKTFTFSDVNFDDFYFDTSDDPKPYKVNIKAKKFVYFKLILQSIENSACIVELNLLSRKGGASK